MTQNVFDNLIVLEMANNHMGDLTHGLRIIDAFAPLVKDFTAFRFAIKFQYRNLDTFIHPDFKKRTDLKYIKRFTETRLSDDDFVTMKNAAARAGFLTMCTPFDEISVDKVAAQKFDFLKIASCSFTDWSLLEKAALTGLPVIASTAGAKLEDIDRVVAFFTHRGVDFCLMHCVGAYPTPDKDLEMNQIDFFKTRYPDIAVGFSTHENPDDVLPAAVAVAKGAQVLERHVGLNENGYVLNAYSSTPAQARAWVRAAALTLEMSGGKDRRRAITPKEAADLRGLQRGVFAARDLKKGEYVGVDDVFFALPNVENQILANDMSKYLKIRLKSDLKKGDRLMIDDAETRNDRAFVNDALKKICELLRDSKINTGDRLDLELSHHYGTDKFYEYGCAIITYVNRAYCKKIIIVLAGQKNPAHRHKVKEETFHILHGDLILTQDGVETMYHAGDIVTIPRGVSHAFESRNGAVFEEISTTHLKGDSEYEDKNIPAPEERKTYMTFYADWLTNGVF